MAKRTCRYDWLKDPDDGKMVVDYLCGSSVIPKGPSKREAEGSESDGEGHVEGSRGKGGDEIQSSEPRNEEIF